MSVLQIRVVLNLHGVYNRITDDGRIEASAMLSNGGVPEEWVDLTGWSREAVYVWLGY